MREPKVNQGKTKKEGVTCAIGVGQEVVMGGGGGGLGEGSGVVLNLVNNYMKSTW